MVKEAKGRPPHANGNGIFEKMERRLESPEEIAADPPKGDDKGKNDIVRITHTCAFCGQQRVERIWEVFT